MSSRRCAECAAERKRYPGLWLIPASSLKEKPGAALSLVDPGLKQTGGCNILVFVTERMHLAHACSHLLVVVAKLSEHIEGVT